MNEYDKSVQKREFEYNQSDFLFIKKILHEKSGIELHEGKEVMVYSRLARRLKELNMSSFKSYCDFVSNPEGASELMQMVNALTTNLTHFFRENHHFEHLKNIILPAHLSSDKKHKMRIWSAGCSTGEEPYSIAMTVLENPQIKSMDFKILATDIDTNVVATAQKGEYQDGSAIPASYISKYCDEKPGGKIQIKQPVKSLIQFNPLNLQDGWPMNGPFDVIFCRNTVIYFSKKTQAVLFDRFANILSPDGWLFIGHSESLYNVTERFELVDKSIYRRKF
jgi:chemotaxis protein methyltransferase CheR